MKILDSLWLSYRIRAKKKEKGGIDEGSRYGLYSLSKGDV
jgi:hypothetical protein